MTPVDLEDGQTCDIEVVPQAVEGSGLEFEIAVTEHCNGVAVNIDANIDDGVADDTLLYSTGSRTAHSQVKSHDIAEITMTRHVVRAYWNWSGNRITSAAHSVYRYDNYFWHRQFASDGSQRVNARTFTAWDDVDWHTDGFPSPSMPDVYLDTKVEVWAYAGGAYSCNFNINWS